MRLDRFWSKVDTSGDCWLWTASVTYRGYGRYRTPERSLSAHRVAWEMTYGPIPPGLFVCHHCDTPRCVRPEHLFLGTAFDNQRDAARKGRLWTGGWRYLPQGEQHVSRTRPELLARGERQGLAKLSDSKVVALRAAYTVAVAGRSRVPRGWITARIGEYGVSAAAIKAAIRGATWRHVV